MNFFILLLLAIIQGITEFLPISSSGHLVLFYNLFGISGDTRLLSIILHLATLLSVLVYYRKDIVLLIKHPFCSTNRKLLCTTIVTCIIVLIIKPFIDTTFDGHYLFVFFIITAILLAISDFVSERKDFLTRTKTETTNTTYLQTKNDILNIPVNYKQSIILGITQAIACIPGISRSGSTIAIGKICGAKDTTRYSFLISIPIIIASFVMEIFETSGTQMNITVLPLITAFIVCFVIGIFAIQLLNKLSKNNNLIYFSYYLITLSTILVILSFFR